MATDKNFVIKNGLTINGSEVITSEGNLTNIGTISSGNITANGTLTTQADSASAGISIKRTNSSTGGSRGHIGFRDSDGYFVASIDSRGTGVNNSGDLRFFTSTGQSYSGVYNNPTATLILGTDNTATFAETISSKTILISSSTGTYQAGSLGYTDSNWGFLYRPPQAGSAGAHLFEATDGTDLLKIEESGNATFAGTVTISSAGAKNALVLSGTSPTMAFTDTTSGNDNFWIHVNSNNFYILADRDGTTGAYNTWETPYPLQLEADTNKGYLFGNEILYDGANISVGTISSTGQVIIDANGTFNTLHIHDDSTAGQPGLILTDTGSQPTSTQTFYAKQYGSTVSASLFGQSVGGKAFVGTEGSASGGLLIGTVTADSVWIGTNNTAALTINSSQAATFSGDMFAKNVVFVGGTSYNENIRMHPGSNDYSSLILGAVSGNSGTGTGQWSLVRYPTATHSNKFTIRHNTTDFLTINTSGNSTFAGTISSGAISANSGATNVVATFTSTDGTAAIALTDSTGTVELSATGTTFGIQPNGGTAVLTVNSSGNLTTSGTISSGDITSGTISTGSGTGGALALTDVYSPSTGDHLANIGWLRSSGGTYIGYGTKQSGSATWLSTFDNFSGKRNYVSFDEDSVTMVFAAAQQTTVGSAVTGLTERFKFDLNNGDFSVNGSTVIDSSKNLTNIGTISASGSASSTSPTLSLTTTDSHTFNHLSNSFASNMTAGESAIHIIGKEGNTKNSGYYGYYWAGAGSNSNFVSIGHWGADHLLRVYGDGTVRASTGRISSYGGGYDVSGTVVIDGSGNLTNIGTIDSGAITSSGQVSGTTLKVENGTYDGFFGNASFSWAGSTIYPTIYGSHSDRWVMFTYPHISYLQNGTNGHTGTTSGSTIRFASDASASNYWDIGIGSTTDLFRIARAGTNAIQISSSGDFTFLNSSHSYVRIESTGSFEQMIRFKNGLANYWYTGLRTSVGIASTADYHIYSTALGNDAAAVDTSGNIIAYNGFKVQGTQVVDSNTNIYSTGIINTNRIKDNGSSGGLGLGNFSTSNVDETASSVVSFLRSGTFDDYIIKGSTNRGVFGRQFIGPHFSSNHSWGVFSSGWDTHFQISGDDRIYMKPNVAIGATPSTTGPVLDVYQTADRPSMTIRSSNPGSWGASLIVGATTANETLVDSNDRAMVIIDGNYPVLNLNHTETTNSNHGPTIQFTHNGYNSNRQWVIGTDGQGDRLDFGVSGGAAGTNTNLNPHNGIAGYQGVTIMRLFDDGVLIGDTGTYPNEVTGPDGKLEVRGNFSHSNGNLLRKTYNKSIGLYANGTASSGSAIGFQQITGEGWSGLFVDYNPYEGWGLYHDNPSNYFLVTSESSTGAIGSGFTVPRRDSGSSTAYTKHILDQNNGNFTAGGSISAQQNVTAYSSDRRLKENFRPIESAIDKVKQLNGLYFDWNKVSEDAGFIPDQKQNDVGLIAQDVQQILPQAVAPAPFDTDVITTPKDPKNKNAGVTQEKISISGENYLTVKYEKLVPLLVEAIKEQQKQIEELKEEVSSLRFKN